VFKKTAKALMSVTVVAVLGMGAALAQEAKPKQAKDAAEVELYKQSSPQTNPNAAERLKALDSWKEKYPETDYKLERAIFYALTYQALLQPAKMFEAAKDVLAIDPKEINALGWATALAAQLPATPDTLSTGEKAAQGLLAVEKPAAGVTDTQWAQMKTAYGALAHNTLGFIANQRKQPDVAEQEYGKSLEVDPTQAQVSYSLGSAILAQKKPARYPDALFYLARAASQTGPGALPAAAQKQIDAFFVKSYVAYHGQDDAGLKELRQLAVGPKPMPPAGFSIKDKNTIEQENDAKFTAEHPELAFWVKLREGLTADNGEQYFEGGVKGAALPPPNVAKKLKGKLVSMKPAIRPKELTLEIEPGKPEVILKFDTALPGKADVGTEIEFEGIADSFTKSPFTLTLLVEDKDKITGWPAAAAAPAKKAPTGVKKAPAKK
jgi:tetratricopeptide (TPR) repeat protein